MFANRLVLLCHTHIKERKGQSLHPSPPPPFSVKFWAPLGQQTYSLTHLLVRFQPRTGSSGRMLDDQGMRLGKAYTPDINLCCGWSLNLNCIHFKIKVSWDNQLMFGCFEIIFLLNSSFKNAKYDVCCEISLCPNICDQRRLFWVVTSHHNVISRQCLSRCLSLKVIQTFLWFPFPLPTHPLLHVLVWSIVFRLDGSNCQFPVCVQTWPQNVSCCQCLHFRSLCSGFPYT